MKDPLEGVTDETFIDKPVETLKRVVEGYAQRYADEQTDNLRRVLETQRDISAHFGSMAQGMDDATRAQFFRYLDDPSVRGLISQGNVSGAANVAQAFFLRDQAHGPRYPQSQVPPTASSAPGMPQAYGPAYGPPPAPLGFSGYTEGSHSRTVASPDFQFPAGAAVNPERIGQLSNRELEAEYQRLTGETFPHYWRLPLES